MIYHFTTKLHWQQAQTVGFYTCPSLQSEGFIHLCKETQCAGVLERYYADATDLLRLSVNESLIISTLKYELSPSVQEEFPHCYGTLNLDAVVAVEHL